MVKRPLTEVGGWKWMPGQEWTNFGRASLLPRVKCLSGSLLHALQNWQVKGKPSSDFSLCLWIFCSNVRRYFLSCFRIISCYSKATSPSPGSPRCSFPGNSHLITLSCDSTVIPILHELCWNGTTIRTERLGWFVLCWFWFWFFWGRHFLSSWEK